MLKDILKSVAPLIGGAIGGPFGGVATKFVLNKLGVDSEEAALAQIEANPDSLLKLREADNEFRTKMRELGIRESELRFKDRDSARNLAVERGILVQAILSAVFITGYFWLIYNFFSGSVAQGLGEWSKGQLGILIGILTAAIPQILSFWFGSSEGSKRKTATMMQAEK